MKILYIDIGSCSKCFGCREIAPEIFNYNEIFGFMETADLQEYDESLVFEAMKNCPKKCIRYEENAINLPGDVEKEQSKVV